MMITINKYSTIFLLLLLLVWVSRTFASLEKEAGHPFIGKPTLKTNTGSYSSRHHNGNSTFKISYEPEAFDIASSIPSPKKETGHPFIGKPALKTNTGSYSSRYHHGNSTFKISYEPEAFDIASSIQHLVNKTTVSVAAIDQVAKTGRGTQMPTMKGEASDVRRDANTASVSKYHEKVERQLDKEAQRMIEQVAETESDTQMPTMKASDVAYDANTVLGSKYQDKVEWQLEEAQRMNQMLLLEVKKLQGTIQWTYPSLTTYAHAKCLEAKERFIELEKDRRVVTAFRAAHSLWGSVLDTTISLVKVMHSMLIVCLERSTKAPAYTASYIHVKWLQIDGMARTFHADLAHAISHMLSILQDSGIDLLAVLTMGGMAFLALKAGKMAFVVLKFLLYYALSICGYGCLHIKVAFLYSGLPTTINSTDKTELNKE